MRRKRHISRYSCTQYGRRPHTIAYSVADDGGGERRGGIFFVFWTPEYRKFSSLLYFGVPYIDKSYFSDPPPQRAAHN